MLTCPTSRCRMDPPSSLAGFPRFPIATRDSRYERVESLRRKIERPALLGALVTGHEDADDVEPILERQPGVLLPEKRTHEMAVLGVVAVDRRFVRDHRHQPRLRVLLLDEILAFPALQVAAEEEIEAAVEGVPRHRVLRTEQLCRQAEAGTDEAP